MGLVQLSLVGSMDNMYAYLFYLVIMLIVGGSFLSKFVGNALRDLLGKFFALVSGTRVVLSCMRNGWCG